MALFFDQSWFDEKLQAHHLTRDDVARALGLSPTEIEEMWKDQRELMTREVSVLAALLNVPPEDVADRAGIATPVPVVGGSAGDTAELAQSLDDIRRRLGRLEYNLEEIKSLLQDNPPSPR
ncbi:MAG: helix-turn-helix transcriptional regulator [Parvularculales bacterium]